MKKSWLALAAVAIYLLSTGCAITDYPVITDSEQTNSSAGTHIVNTSGQALIVPELQVVTFYPDSADELLSFVDQDQNGNQTIYTHNNFCEVGNPCYGGDWFAGMQFLNANRTGCWIWKAQNPVSGDADIFDGDENPNCSGARSLSVLASVGRFMESGKDGGNGKNTTGGSSVSQLFNGGVSIQDAIAALGQLDSLGTYGFHPEYGVSGWKITLSPANSELWLDNTRFMIDGLVVVIDVKSRGLLIDTRTGNAFDMLTQLAGWVESNGQRATLSVTFAGISPTVDIGLMDAAHYYSLADRVAGS